MQGTGAVVMAGLFNALKVTGTRWRDQRVVILGGGTAGVGIADQIRAQMTRDGLDEATAARQIWIVDLPGLLTDDMGDGQSRAGRQPGRRRRAGRRPRGLPRSPGRPAVPVPALHRSAQPRAQGARLDHLASRTQFAQRTSRSVAAAAG
jgi:hypothetical protein